MNAASMVSAIAGSTSLVPTMLGSTSLTPSILGSTSLASSTPLLLAMAMLIVASGTLSGSEAALFSITARDRRRLPRLSYGCKVADKLLDDPERLLSAILFWNLLVNMTYFALAAIIASGASQRSAAVAISGGSLLAIIFFSEMLPKSLAMQSPVRATGLLAPPIAVVVAIISPLLPSIIAANAVVSRLVWPTLQNEPEIDLRDIQRAIELGTGDAALLGRERGAMRGLLALADVRVTEWMRPRNRCRVTAGQHAPSDLFDAGYDDDSADYVLVQDGQDDLVTRAIVPRYLRPAQIDSPNDLGTPVVYVPWSAQVSQALDLLHAEDRDVAIVLDEFGSWLGAIATDEILRRVLVDDPPPPESKDPTGGDSNGSAAPLEVPGSESFRAVAKQLGVDLEVEGVSTMAGLIQRANERFPQIGDTATLGEYVCEVVDRTDDEVVVRVRSGDEPS